MPFAYYRRLSRRNKQIYRLSDEVEVIILPAGHGLEKPAERLATALAAEEQRLVTRLCNELAGQSCRLLGVRPVRIKVLARRPSDDTGELHGLYESSSRRDPQITVWMRTVQRKQVVAYRTFLRTLLHELCHHLDYELLRLDESFHTEGFYKRESSLFKQLVPGIVR